MWKILNKNKYCMNHVDNSLDRPRHRNSSTQSFLLSSIDKHNDDIRNVDISSIHSTSSTSITGGDVDATPTIIDSTNEDDDVNYDAEVYVDHNVVEGRSSYNNGHTIGLDIDHNSSEVVVEENLKANLQGKVLIANKSDDNTNVRICKLNEKEQLVSPAVFTPPLRTSQSDPSFQKMNDTTIKKSKSSISIMKKVNSSQSLASSCNSNKSSVRFGSIEIHGHGIELDHGGVSSSIRSKSNGPALTLGWERLSYEKLDSIDAHQERNKNVTPPHVLHPLPAEQRIDT